MQTKQQQPAEDVVVGLNGTIRFRPVGGDHTFSLAEIEALADGGPGDAAK